MGKVYISGDGLSKDNLVAPIVIAGVYIPKSFIYTPPSDSNVYRLNKKTLNYMLNLWPLLICDFYVCRNHDIFKEGVYGSIYKAQKKVIRNITARIILQNINEEFTVEIVDRLDKTNKEARLAYAIAKVIRRNYLKSYDKLFKSLELLKNNGSATKNHKQNLLNLELLPDFYIWDRVLRYVSGLDAKWIHREIQHFEKITGVQNNEFIS